MKKILITLAILATLTACSSSKDVKDKEIDADLAVSNEVIIEETVEMPVPEVMPEIVQPIEEVNELVTLYDKDGVRIISENNEVTLIMPSNVLFDFDKSTITENFKPLLNLVADSLNNNDDLRATVSGHTDNIGTDSYNENLSAKRAAAAKNFLTEAGVEEDRITTVGYGSSRPVDVNTTAEGRDNNRRIEITITK